MVARVDIHGSRDLQATVLAIKRVDTDLRKQIRQQTREAALPIFQRAMAENAAAAPDTLTRTRVLVQTARLTVSDQSIKATSATQKRAVLSGGLKPAIHGGGIEFGATNKDKTRSYTYRNKKGTRVIQHNRHTARQMPPRRQRGAVFYPTLNDELIPRILSLWMQTALRTIGDALDHKGAP